MYEVTHYVALPFVLSDDGVITDQLRRGALESRFGCAARNEAAEPR